MFIYMMSCGANMSPARQHTTSIGTNIEEMVGRLPATGAFSKWWGSCFTADCSVSQGAFSQIPDISSTAHSLSPDWRANSPPHHAHYHDYRWYHVSRPGQHTGYQGVPSQTPLPYTKG